MRTALLHFFTFASFFLVINCTAANATTSIWDHWKKGDMQSAEQGAKRLLSTDADQANHALTLIYFVQGKFEKAIYRQKLVSKSYPRRSETLSPVIEAYRHLNKYKDAHNFAVQNKISSQELLRVLSQLSAEPPQFSLSQTTFIPFKISDPLNPFLPAVEMEVSGEKVIGHLDTGGTFIVMSTKLADKLRLKYFYVGAGHCNDMHAKVYFGQADINLGDIRVTKIPISISDCLNDTPPLDSRVIFGTNLLERFLSTIDYPRNQLIISPYQKRWSHFSAIQKNYRNASRQNFFIWSDHYMFAQGKIGAANDLNFFIDTGLVSFHPDGRQAAFYTSTGNLLKWGYDANVLKQNGVVDLNGNLTLGDLDQSGQAALHQNQITFNNFGGIEIHGLVGHAFLKTYSWTIDFEKMKYEFGY